MHREMDRSNGRVMDRKTIVPPPLPFLDSSYERRTHAATRGSRITASRRQWLAMPPRIGEATMDGNRFDALSRAMAVAGSRRRVIRALAGIAAGGAVASLEVDQAGARPALCRPGGRYCTWNHQCCNNICRIGKRYPWRTRNVCECTAPDGWCGNVCTKLGTDKRNCGSCGHKCLPGEVCHDGQCWRQLGQTCDRDNIHDHECEPDLTCEHNRKVCVGPA